MYVATAIGIIEKLKKSNRGQGKMKTKEFIKRVEKLGYEIRENDIEAEE